MHEYHLRIYYEDTDAGGVVYHASYIRFAERARTEALRDAGLPHSEMQREHDCIFMVRRVDIEYLRPARLDAWLRIVTSVEHLGGASVRLRQAMDEDGQAVAVATVWLVCVGLGDMRPVRIPGRWRELFAGWMGEMDRGSNG